MALYLDVGPDDVLRIGESFLTIERKSGARARLRIMSTSEVELMRKARLRQDAEKAAPEPAGG